MSRRMSPSEDNKCNCMQINILNIYYFNWIKKNSNNNNNNE